MIDRLRADGLIYEGTLEPTKGPRRPMTGSRASRPCSARTISATDVDRPLRQIRRQQHVFRQRHRLPRRQAETVVPTLLIDVIGADHGGYVKSMTGSGEGAGRPARRAAAARSSTC